MLDLMKLAATGGKERTAEKYAVLLASGGFELTRVVPTASAFGVAKARSV